MGRFDGKTEQATPQRRKKMRDEGNIARSPEIAVAASLLAAMVTLRVFGPAGFATLHEQTAALFSQLPSDEIPFDVLAGRMVKVVLALALPFLAVGAFSTVAVNVAQVGFALRPKAFKPKWSNLSPKRGLERFRPSVALWELVRSVAKLGLLGVLVWEPVQAWTQGAIRPWNLESGIASTSTQAWSILLRVVALAVVIAAADYVYNRRKKTREGRMSKEEVKQEYKNSEGDPLVRAQRKRRAMELSRNRMLRDVATADVVITNPTHFAVALKYADGDAAPRVVAKGTNLVARRIRSIAYRNGIVVTENRPLARALHRQCKVGGYVPSALYEAVAVVLAIAYRRYGRRAA